MLQITSKTAQIAALANGHDAAKAAALADMSAAKIAPKVLLNTRAWKIPGAEKVAAKVAQKPDAPAISEQAVADLVTLREHRDTLSDFVASLLKQADASRVLTAKQWRFVNYAARELRGEPLPSVTFCEPDFAVALKAHLSGVKGMVAGDCRLSVSGAKSRNPGVITVKGAEKVTVKKFGRDVERTPNFGTISEAGDFFFTAQITEAEAQAIVAGLIRFFTA